MNRRVLQIRLTLFLMGAFIVQSAFGGSMAIRGARPDIALTALLVCCLYVSSAAGAAYGMMIGLLSASYFDRFVGSIIVSRTIGGFLLGALEERIFRDSVFMALAAATLGTIAVEGLFFVFAPQPHALRWIIRTLEAAAYNGVLSLPIFWLVHRIAKPRQ
jgi:rod shape-determining protein MreD